MVSIFPKLCLRRRSLCSNLGDIGPEKLCRATLKRIHPASKKNATAPPQQTLCVALVKGRDAESDVLVEIIGYPRLCGFFQHPENVRENGRLYFHLFAYVSFYVVSGAPGGLQVMQ